MTTTLAKTSVVKRSITIRQDLDQKLTSYPNRSNIINSALELFFQKNAHLERAEADFWREQIEQGLQDVREGKATVMNPGGGKMTREQIARNLGI